MTTNSQGTVSSLIRKCLIKKRKLDEIDYEGYYGNKRCMDQYEVANRKRRKWRNKYYKGKKKINIKLVIMFV